MLTLASGACTDTGLTRSANQDTILTRSAPEYEGRGGRLFIVADGVGGAEHGEIASKIAAQTIADAFYKLVGAGATQPVAIRAAIEEASARVHVSATARGVAGNMGTTVVCAAVHGDRMTVGWVGDSRVYIARDGFPLVQITRDHSYVAEQMRSGTLSAEEARGHPQRNRLSRSVGGSPTVQVDVVTGGLMVGDMVMLCSDGLTHHLGEREIDNLLRQAPAVDDAAETLVAMANARGGHDNISVILLDMRREVPLDGSAFEADTQLKRSVKPSEDAITRGWFVTV